MIDPLFWTIARVAGLVLVLGSVATFSGFMMFWIRGGHRGGAPRSRAHFVWERSFIMAGVVLTTIGFVLLEGSFQNTDGRILATSGAAAYLFGGVLLVAGEAFSLTFGYEKLYNLIVIYVVVAFLAQAAIGGAMIHSALLAAWIGWATILWNVAGLVALSLIARRDMYFPVLHHFAPLLIGIALLGSIP